MFLPNPRPQNTCTHCLGFRRRWSFLNWRAPSFARTCLDCLNVGGSHHLFLIWSCDATKTGFLSSGQIFFFDSCQKVRQTLPNITKHVPTRVGLTPHDSRVHWLILALRVHEFLQFLWFPSNAQKHAGRWVGFAKLPLGVSECLNVCLQCTRSGLVSHLDCILEFEIEIWTGLYSQRPWPG